LSACDEVTGPRPVVAGGGVVVRHRRAVSFVGGEAPAASSAMAVRLPAPRSAAGRGNKRNWSERWRGCLRVLAFGAPDPTARGVAAAPPTSSTPVVSVLELSFAMIGSIEDQDRCLACARAQEVSGWLLRPRRRLGFVLVTDVGAGDDDLVVSSSQTHTGSSSAPSSGRQRVRAALAAALDCAVALTGAAENVGHQLDDRAGACALALPTDL
jgi:hypothetical protein